MPLYTLDIDVFYLKRNKSFVKRYTKSHTHLSYFLLVKAENKKDAYSIFTRWVDYKEYGHKIHYHYEATLTKLSLQANRVYEMRTDA
jgi:hypothetical protein